MKTSRPSLGFTLVELLVAIAIIALLVALLLPAVMSAREASRITVCKNNLKQISLATLLHHDALLALPPARLMPRPGDDEVCGVGTPTWMVRILPYMEEANFYGQWDLKKRFDAHPESVRTRSVESFFCPSRRDSGASLALSEDVTREFTVTVPSPLTTQVSWCPDCGPKPPAGPEPDDPDRPDGGDGDSTESLEITYKRGALSDYAANHGDSSPGFVGAATDFGFGGNGTGLIISSRPRCNAGGVNGWRDKIGLRNVLDGTSKTLLIGESHVKLTDLGVPPVDGPAYDGNHLPSSARIAGVGFPLAKSLRDDAPVYSFGSWHSGICQFAMADGSVRAMGVDIGSVELGRLAHRADGIALEGRP